MNDSRIDTEAPPETIALYRCEHGWGFDRMMWHYKHPLRPCPGVICEPEEITYVLSSVVAEREKLLWVIRELHEGACSPAYRPPDSDYRLWALEVIESNIAEEVLNG